MTLKKEYDRVFVEMLTIKENLKLNRNKMAGGQSQIHYPSGFPFDVVSTPASFLGSKTMNEIDAERQAEWRNEDKEYYRSQEPVKDNSHLTEDKEFDRTRGIK